MAKEFFKNLPDTSTPLSAERLNGFLNGEESMGSITVEDIACKNLFDINGEINILDNSDDIAVRNTVSNNILTTTTNSWAQHSTGQKITGVANKTITISADVISTGTGQYGIIPVYNNSGTTIVSQKATANNKILITCTPTTDTIKICFATTGDTQAQSGTGAQFTNIQVEIGEVATDYVGYKEFGYTNSDLIKKLFNIPSEKLRSTDNIDNFYNELGVKVYSIWDELPIGMPTGAYVYGCLIVITQSLTSYFLNTQIYITDSPAAHGVFFRNGTNTNWVKLTGTSVAKTTN